MLILWFPCLNQKLAMLLHEEAAIVRTTRYYKRVFRFSEQAANYSTRSLTTPLLMSESAQFCY